METAMRYPMIFSASLPRSAGAGEGLEAVCARRCARRVFLVVALGFAAWGRHAEGAAGNAGAPPAALAPGAFGADSAGATADPLQALPPIDVAALLEQIEGGNPAARANRASREAAAHAAPEATALPDPVASVFYTNDTIQSFTLGSSEFSNLAFSWSQELLYPGKRKLAGRAAEAELAVFDATLLDSLASARASLKAGYSELLRIDRTTRALSESHALLLVAREAARARYESGLGGIAPLLQAQILLTKLEGRMRAQEPARRATEAAVQAVIGGPIDAPLGRAESDWIVSEPDPSDLAERIHAGDPAILESVALEERERRRLELARSGTKPDLTWTATYMNRGGLDPMVAAGIAVRLPLYHETKQDRAIAAAESSLAAAQLATSRREAEAQAELRALLARSESAQAMLRAYEQGVIPQTTTAYEAASSAYSSGQGTLDAVVATLQGILDARIEAEAQRAERAIALARIESLTGVTLLAPVSPSVTLSEVDR